jgi:hypothetical protein
MKLRAHPNVVDLAEERRRRERAVPFVMSIPPGYRAVNVAPRSHPAAEALLAGLLLGIGERDNDAAMIAAGKRLADAAQERGEVARIGDNLPSVPNGNSKPTASDIGISRKENHGRPAASGWRQRPKWFRALLGTGQAFAALLRAARRRAGPICGRAPPLKPIPRRRLHFVA